jgi:hypothetical protein
MAKSGLTFEPTKGSNFAHNNREHQIDYLVEGKFWCDRTENEAQEYLTTLRHEAMENYTKRTGQKMQIDINDNKYLWSASVNLNQEHTIEDLQDLAKELEKKHGWQCVQCAVHFDEGHINERDVIEYNRHGHLEFFMVSKEGTTAFKKKDFRQKDMSELQTFVAERLKMERGKIYHETGEYKKHLKPQAFKSTKRELETVKTLANENDLKEEVAQLRATLKEMGGKREDYAKLEALTKDLKEKVKSQIITIDDLKEQINAHKTLINDLQSKNKALDKEIATKDEKINSRANMSVKEITEKEADKELVTLIKSHYEVQTVYDKSEQKGFLGTKEVYQKTQKNVLHEPKTFFEKVKDLAVKGSEYIQDKYNRLMVAYGKLEEKHSEALSRVEELERELKEARAELQSLKGQKVERYEEEMRVTHQFEVYKGYRYKHDSEMTSESKDIKAQIAQTESKIANIEEKLENAKDKYDLAYDEVNARASSMSDSERKYANEWSKKLAYAQATKREVPTYEYIQTKQGYNNKLNEIPKLPEEQEKPKARKPFVRS